MSEKPTRRSFVFGGGAAVAMFAVPGIARAQEQAPFSALPIEHQKMFTRYPKLWKIIATHVDKAQHKVFASMLYDRIDILQKAPDTVHAIVARVVPDNVFSEPQLSIALKILDSKLSDHAHIVGYKDFVHAALTNTRLNPDDASLTMTFNGLQSYNIPFIQADPEFAVRAIKNASGKIYNMFLVFYAQTSHELGMKVVLPAYDDSEFVGQVFDKQESDKWAQRIMQWGPARLLHHNDGAGVALNKALEEGVPYYMRHALNPQEAHPSRDKRRGDLKAFDNKALYALLAHGKGELWTSTFQVIMGTNPDGSYNKEVSLGAAIEQAGGIDMFFQSVDPHNIWTLNVLKKLAALSRFDGERDSQGNPLSTLTYYLQALPKDRAEAFLSTVMLDALSQGDLLHATVSLAGTIHTLLQSPYVDSVVARALWERFKRMPQTDPVRPALGVLISMHASVSAVIDIVPSASLQELTKEYPIADAEHIKIDTLIDKHGALNRRVYFHHDDDGIGSFEHFINTRKALGWSITEHRGFIELRKRGLADGALRGIRIFANDPRVTTADGQGNKVANQSATNDYIKEQGIAIRSIVHRGHSYHVGATIRLAQGMYTPAQFNLGSCGGADEVGRVAGAFPGVDMIATGSTGYKAVNDPLFAFIDNEMLHGETRWRHIWKKIQERKTSTGKRLREVSGWGGYLAPYENIGPQIAKMLYKAGAVTDPNQGEQSLAR